MAINQESRFKGGLPDYLIRHTTFRQMQIFEAIVRLGSFTKAAEELFLTQPTVSTQFKKLSEALDISLLDQSSRQLKPTEAGEELYNTVCKVFDNLAELDTHIAELKGLSRGRLRLSVITTAKHFAPEVLGSFSREYPGVDLSLEVCNRERMFERIQNNEDDLYILGQPPSKELSLEAHLFAPNPLVVIAARDHELCKESNISIDRLAQEPLIVREPGSGIRNTSMKVFSERGLTPNIRMELGSNEAIKHAVVGGLGVAILSLHTLSLEGVNGPIEVLDVEDFPIKRKWFLVHQKNKKLSSITKAFIEFALAEEPVIRDRMTRLYDQFIQRRKKRKQNS